MNSTPSPRTSAVTTTRTLFFTVCITFVIALVSVLVTEGPSGLNSIILPFMSAIIIASLAWAAAKNQATSTDNPKQDS